VNDSLTLYGAVFSDCRTWRYVLWRKWDRQRPMLNVIGLNPSTADETKDDPTIRRCVGFARSWGYGGLVMTNVFAYRSTDPNRLRWVDNPVGLANLAWIEREARRAGKVLAAWGALHKDLAPQAERVRTTLHKNGVRVWCLAKTKAGHPAHPLYQPAARQPVRL